MLSAPHSPPIMHIPDGFLSVGVAVLLWIVTIVIVAISLKRVSNDLGPRQVPMMGIVAAAIFAGQMLNFPVAGGTFGAFARARLWRRSYWDPCRRAGHGMCHRCTRASLSRRRTARDGRGTSLTWASSA